MLTVRYARPDDGGALAEIYRYFVLNTAVSFEETPPTAQQMAQRIRDISDIYPFLVCCDDGVPIGYVYASEFHARASYRWSVYTSVYIKDGYRRRGVATALYSALLYILKHQGYVHAFASVTMPSPSSTGLHHALGFVDECLFPKVGYKLGKWHDVAYYKLLLNSVEQAPQEPIGMEALKPEILEAALGKAEEKFDTCL